MSLTPTILAEIGRIRAEIGRPEAQESTLVRLLALSSAVHADAEHTAPVSPQPEEASHAPPQVERLVKPARGRKNGWSPDELRILRENYPEMGAAVTRLLPGRNQHAIRQKAKKEGIRRGRGKRLDVEPMVAAQLPAHQPALNGTGKPPRSFDEQLAMVERGEARVVDKFVMPRAEPTHTLGGVVGEIL